MRLINTVRLFNFTVYPRIITSLVLLLVVLFGLSSFHIVGGEIEFITLEPGKYRINVIQYFDKSQDDNPGPEGQVEVFIFSNKDDRFISSHVLFFEEELAVRYTNQECSIKELSTSRVVWTADIELDPQAYSDPEGYYIVWERCCRNANVKNIVNPLGSGMKYVSEIPPLWVDNQPFVNSSPILFRPLRDYACVGQLYYVEFTGSDPDGDSLAYSLANPLNSSAAVALPIPQPKPHPELFFSSGYSVSNTIPGSPPLAINRKGLLTVSPTEEGLFVFSVLVEEFRKGKKIGSVQRDFQMLVIDGCTPPDPPQVGVQIPDRPDFQADSDTLFYTLTDDKCFTFVVTNLGDSDTITFRAEGVNFEGDFDEIFSLTQTPVLGRDSLLVEVCAPGCPPTNTLPFTVDLIAGDDACPLPQLDTLRLTFVVEPPPNAFPFLQTGNREIIVNEDQLFQRNIVITDSDLDSLTVQLVGEDGGALPESIGLSFQVVSDEPGRLEGILQWDTDCLIYDFSTQQQFRVQLIVEDKDDCALENPDKIWFDFEVILPPNTSPQVSLSGIPALDLTIEPDTFLNFDVLAVDADGDTVSLRMDGLEFNPAAFLASMSPVEGTGSAKSKFDWLASCTYTSETSDNLFPFLFIADDKDKCDVKNFDTLRLNITIDLPINNPPTFDPIPVFTADINLPIRIPIRAFDLDEGDSLSIDWFSRSNRPNSSSLELISVNGIGEAFGEIRWTPECSLLGGEKSKTFRLVLEVTDFRCPISRSDTVSFLVEVVETADRFAVFNPPNAFTPNGDGINDYFTLHEWPLPEQNLPVDICEDFFLYFAILDRTGKEVYYTKSREFRWDGENLPSGVYYYVIKYSKTTYKGYLQLLR